MWHSIVLVPSMTLPTKGLPAVWAGLAMHQALLGILLLAAGTMINSLARLGPGPLGNFSALEQSHHSPEQLNVP